MDTPKGAAQSGAVMKGRAEQRDATRAKLVASARRLFAKSGYEATSLTAVCRAARVTQGAVYHHFPEGKTQLFAAVVEVVMREVANTIIEVTRDERGWKRLEMACDAYLDCCADPEVLTIVFRDAPRVLRPEVFQSVDRAANEPLMVGLLREAEKEGVIPSRELALSARLLGKAFEEAGQIIAEASRAERPLLRVRLQKLLLGWLAAPPR